MNKYKKNFEYFFNAIYYILWLFEISSWNFINKSVEVTIGRLTNILLSKKRIENKSQLCVYANDPRDGMNIVSARQILKGIFFVYPLWICTIVIGLLVCFSKFGQSTNIIISSIIACIISLVSYYFLEKTVFANYKYLKYFKYFKKKNKVWHKKWKNITWLFIFVSIIMFFFDFLTGYLVIYLFKF